MTWFCGCAPASTAIAHGWSEIASRLHALEPGLTLSVLWSMETLGMLPSNPPGHVRVAMIVPSREEALEWFAAYQAALKLGAPPGFALERGRRPGPGAE